MIRTFPAKDFTENHGSTSWGAKVRYGRHVLEFPTERINPDIPVQIAELNLPSSDHAAILYTVLVATADRLHSITNVD